MWALGTALAITAVVFVAELVGGWLSGSMALMADAMHMLSDSTSLAIAFIAVFIGSRVRSARATYGYRRVEVLAAALNAATVLLVSVWIVYQAFGRFGAGAEVDTRTMIIVAVVGLIANVASAWVLNAQREKSLNVEGAFLHVIVDLFGSVAVIIAGGVIALTGWQVADVIASLLIAALVVPRAWQLLKSSTSVLLEQVPEGIDPRQVQEELEGLSGVEAVHDLHLWSTNGSDALCTAHLITRLAEPFRLLDLAQERLTALGIAHATIQIERPEHSAHETFCEPGQ
ncbi:cation diffusion facilitator family transporter [Corynebacterium aquatimens]|nr:cation diffusion facilitator family transporter [Corynebacterium aquatimens]WJY66021.1 Cadmium, cobalt and zinc/H(+)-K(+) antiporter [Corynebacterium aquatimens]